jgi:pimeloyl-ACP methyl ester carboxylesterase
MGPRGLDTCSETNNMQTLRIPLLLLALCLVPTAGAQPNDPPADEKPSAEEIRRQAGKLHAKLYKAFQRKDYAAAAAACQQAAKLPLSGRLRSQFLYNHACALARLGKPEAAMGKLTEAVESGWTNLGHLEEDPDLASLRKLDAYRKIVKKLTTDAGPTVEASKDKTVITGRAGRGFAYRVLLPPGASADAPHRLVVWLHPSGSLANHAPARLAGTLWKHGLGLLVFEGKGVAGWTGQDIQRIGPTLQAVAKADRIDARRPLLLGYSAGGQAGLVLWRQDPEAWGGLILDAAYPLDMDAYAAGKVKLLSLPDGKDFDPAPVFVLVGDKDGGARLWKQAQAQWKDRIPHFTVHYVPNGRHAWLFGKEQVQQLDDWLGKIQTGKEDKAGD